MPENQEWSMRPEVSVMLDTLSRRADANSDRISLLEQRMASSQTLTTSLADGVKEAKDAALRTSDKIDALKMWMLGFSALLAANVLLMLFKK